MSNVEQPNLDAPEQSELETLWLAKDENEVWHTYCREHAIKFGKERGLVLAVDPLRHTTVKPEYMLTPADQERPADELVEPESFESLPIDSDCPLACEDPSCGLWLDCALTEAGINYLQDEDFTPQDRALYLGGE